MTMVEQMMTEMTGVSGGMEEIVQSVMEQMMNDMTVGLDEVVLMMEQMEQMSDEEFIQQIVGSMTDSGDMAELFGDMNLNGKYCTLFVYNDPLIS